VTSQRKPDFAALHAAFAVPGALVGAAPHGSGHINDTFLVRTTAIPYVLQRINTAVFRDPVRLMQNVARVIAHVRTRRRGREALELYPTRAGGVCHFDAHGEAWRALAFIEGAHTVDVIESPAQAEAAARAFGAFQRLLVDLPGPRLHETLPHFHDSPRRLVALEDAAARDAHGRTAGALSELDFALAQEPLTREITRRLADGTLPERVTHNDTKLNNVLFDDRTGEALCVIDLDTVMPGAAVYDFGDLVRTMTCAAAEDERDLSKVELRLDLYEAIARGYLDAARAFLTPAEVATLVVGGTLITFETGMRFLTDHLQGDGYFRIHHPGQNLDRARTQFALTAQLERARPRLEEIVARYATGGLR
jgi:Ser/Thr protein kinase RdoA (MazF antagonist)